MTGRIVPAFTASTAPVTPPDTALRRVPVQQRAQADYSGEAMNRYISGLQARLLAHVQRHAPAWQQRETRQILNRWQSPAFAPPPPAGVARRDRMQDASDYAARLVSDRIATRLMKLHDIAVSRRLEVSGLKKTFQRSVRHE